MFWKACRLEKYRAHLALQKRRQPNEIRESLKKTWTGDERGRSFSRFPPSILRNNDILNCKDYIEKRTASRGPTFLDCSRHAGGLSDLPFSGGRMSNSEKPID